jgi:hypothetical protein
MAMAKRNSARQLADWAQTAACRLAMALAYREDMQQLIGAARTECARTSQGAEART